MLQDTFHYPYKIYPVNMNKVNVFYIISPVIYNFPENDLKLGGANCLSIPIVCLYKVYIAQLMKQYKYRSYIFTRLRIETTVLQNNITIFPTALTYHLLLV